MARFLAAIEGQGKEVHRLGGPNSGIRAQAQGWHVGVKVYGQADDEHDVFQVYATGGSAGNHRDVFLGTVALDAEGEIVFSPAGDNA